MQGLERFRATIDLSTGEVISLIEIFDASGAFLSPPTYITAANGAVDSDGLDFAASLAARQACSSGTSGKQEFLTICRVDDINGDQTEYVPYQEIWCKEYDGTDFTSTLIGTFSDEACTIPYTAINPATAPGEEVLSSGTETVCSLDDVNQDGSVIVPYVSVFYKAVTPNGVISSLIGHYTDQTCTVAYDPVTFDIVGIERDKVPLTPRVEEIVGPGSFTIPSNAITYALVVTEIGNIAIPPTILDGAGVTTNLPAVGFNLNSEAQRSAGFTAMPTITANAGDRIIISWNEA